MAAALRASDPLAEAKLTLMGAAVPRRGQIAFTTRRGEPDWDAFADLLIALRLAAMDEAEFEHEVCGDAPETSAWATALPISDENERRARRVGVDVVGRLVNGIDSERYARDYAAASADPRRAELARAAAASERAALRDVIELLEEEM